MKLDAMSVRTARSPLSTYTRPSSGQSGSPLHSPHPPSWMSPYKTGTTGGRPLPKGPGPLDENGRKLNMHRIKGTDFNGNQYKTPTSTFRPKKYNLNSSSSISPLSQPVRAVHNSGLSSSPSRRYEGLTRQRSSSPQESSPLSYSSGTSLRGRRSQSHSDLVKEIDHLKIEDSPTRVSPYKQSSFGTLPESLHRTNTKESKQSSSPLSSYRVSRYSEPHYISSTYRNRLSGGVTSSSGKTFARQDALRSFSRRSESESPSYLDRSHGARTLSRAASLPASSSTEREGLVGLHNLGNTCFLNAIVQCLSHTKVLLRYCLKEDYHLDLNTSSTTKGQLMQAYAQVMKHLWRPNGEKSFNPRQFKGQVEKFARQFAGYSQQDAQEFLRFLLEGLHEDVNAVKKKPRYDKEIAENLSDEEKAKEAWDRYKSREKSPISELFVGQLKSTLECTVCGYKSTTYDPFWDLSLPIPRNKSSVSLMDCLKLFTKSEVLDKEEKPICAKCKSRQVCTKTFSIQRFPQVLVIHLKRFSGRSKLSTFVDFPQEGLSLKEFAADSCLGCNYEYNLNGIVNHFGSLYGGHYTATCKHAKQQKWFRYDDERVESVSSGSTTTSQAYVLFYEQDGHSSNSLL